MVHEHRGVPDGLIVCHLPFGPTAYFGLSNVVCRPFPPSLSVVDWDPWYPFSYTNWFFVVQEF